MWSSQLDLFLYDDFMYMVEFLHILGSFNMLPAGHIGPGSAQRYARTAYATGGAIIGDLLSYVRRSADAFGSRNFIF